MRIVGEFLELGFQQLRSPQAKLLKQLDRAILQLQILCMFEWQIEKHGFEWAKLFIESRRDSARGNGSSLRIELKCPRTIAKEITWKLVEQ